MGNPFVHVELMSTDVSKSKSFYGSLFDWDLEDVRMPEMMYTMIKVSEGTGGGMLKNPMPGASSSWLCRPLRAERQQCRPPAALTSFGQELLHHFVALRTDQSQSPVCGSSLSYRYCHFVASRACVHA